MTSAVLPSPSASCARCTFFEPVPSAVETPEAPAPVGGCRQPRHVTLRLRVTAQSACADFERQDAGPRGDGNAHQAPPSSMLVEHVAPDATPDQAFILQRVQPALLGLMDGSVSTLAPIFAAAGLTGQPMNAFWIGTAASLGAGISMGLAEALSDDGIVTGRGLPLGRGLITGFATVLGGMLHTVPFLLPNLQMALYLAYVVVLIELLVIAYIRYRYMRTPLVKTVAQVIVGGGIVFAVGLLLGQLGVTD